MSGGGAPEDKSDKVAQIEAQQAADARAADAAKAEQQRNLFNSQVNSAYNTALDSARQYFISRGLDPDQYVPQITSTLNSERGSIPDLAANPGTYFTGAGETAYNTARDAQRGQLQRAINQFAPSGFETRKIGDTSDDATLAAILAEQRATADNYVRNLLDRGVINASGFASAESDLDNQAYGAKSRLQEIGNTVLQQGRSKITNLANEARSGAANFELGDNFDPYSYSTDIDAALNDFFTNLGGNIRGLAPTGLFNTAGLANIAGAAMGAQNLKFSPAALAGTSTKEEDDNANKTNFLSAF
jgi:hypothetical protein